MTPHEKLILLKIEHAVRDNNEKLNRGDILWLIDKLKESEGMR